MIVRRRLELAPPTALEKTFAGLLMTDAPSGSPASCTPACRGVRVRQLAGAALLLGAFPVAHALTPFLLRDTVPLCPFRIATGKPCPLCGLTRAIALATHGRWRAAFALNPLWPLFAATMLLLGFLLLADALAGRRRSARLGQIMFKRWFWILATLGAFDVWRIASGR